MNVFCPDTLTLSHTLSLTHTHTPFTLMVCFTQWQLHPSHGAVEYTGNIVPIGLLNMRGKDTESENVIAINKANGNFSTCVLLLLWTPVA